jgi:hypothetical protein
LDDVTKDSRLEEAGLGQERMCEICREARVLHEL